MENLSGVTEYKISYFLALSKMAEKPILIISTDGSLPGLRADKKK